MRKNISEIPGFEIYTNYEIDSDGFVVSLMRQQGRFITNKIKILKPKTTKNGYLSVQLCQGNIRKHIMIHRLVAFAFVSNPENKPHVNHIDSNKKQNRAYNLEWVTNEENMNHAKDKGLIKSRENHPNAKLTNNQVEGVMFLLECQPLMSIKEIAKWYNVTPNSISHINTGKTWIHEEVTYPLRESR